MSGRTECATHCFRCGREIRVERDEDGYMDTMHGIKDGCGGLFFRTSGNYGSTIFDPEANLMARSAMEFLEIVICDDCVVKHQNEIDHVKVKHQKSKRVVSLFEIGK